MTKLIVGMLFFTLFLLAVAVVKDDWFYVVLALVPFSVGYYELFLNGKDENDSKR